MQGATPSKEKKKRNLKTTTPKVCLFPPYDLLRSSYQLYLKLFQSSLTFYTPWMQTLLELDLVDSALPDFPEEKNSYAILILR